MNTGDSSIISNKEEGDIDYVTEAISNNLVLDDGSSNKSFPKAKGNLSLRKPGHLNAVACRENCCHSSHHSPGHPVVGPPILVPLKRVKIEEHGDTHEINIDGNGLVTINYMNYQSENQMQDIMSLITKDLSEPYSVYTYRYFIHNWPKLSFLAYCEEKCIGAIVCKLDVHKKRMRRGYIAMLAVDNSYRRHQIGSNLVIKAIRMMSEQGCDEVVLETEITNVGALRLYENLGFVRDKRLFKYYLNGVDALRLKLWLR